MLRDIEDFLHDWQTDPLNAKKSFESYLSFLDKTPGILLSFKSRPGISYSLRAKHQAQNNRDLFALIDVVDDEPSSRWLSVCFYADLVSDPRNLGDLVPNGLFDEDAICFNLDEDDPDMREYIGAKLAEAAKNAAA